MNGPVYERDPRTAGEPPVVDVNRLWGGGLATAAVACLVAFVGVLIARGVFDVELLSPRREGALGDSTTAAYVVMAGVGALVATLILQILVSLTPQPLTFFSWIIGLVMLTFAVAPFTTDAKLSSQVATGLINLFVGLVIMTLLPRIGYSALTPEPRPRPR
jgi:uncharacterized protein DUF6069